MNTSQQEFLDYMSETLQTSHESLMQMKEENPQNFSKLVEKVKRAMRREKAKQRKHKDDVEIVPSSRKIKRRKEEDETAKENDKKTIQMIRNRISAQNSRDRKKQYLHQLESQAQREYTRNVQLRKELEELQAKNQKLNQKSSKIRDQLSIIQQIGGGSRLGKIGLALLTLVSVFSVISQKETQPSLPTPLVKLEELSSDSAMMPIHYDKSYSIVDTNTFFEEEKIGVSEESDNCYHIPNQMYRLPIDYEYMQLS